MFRWVTKKKQFSKFSAHPALSERILFNRATACRNSGRMLPRSSWRFTTPVLNAMFIAAMVRPPASMIGAATADRPSSISSTISE